MSGVSSSESSARPQSPPRRQRACLACTKAKARCHYKNNELGDGCNRCQRMRILCAPPTTKSLRKPRQVKRQHEQSDDVGPEPTSRPWAPKTTNYGGSLLAISKPGVYSLPSTSPNVSSTTSPSISNASATPRHQNRTQQLSQPSSTLSGGTPNVPPSPGFSLTWSQADEAIAKFNTHLTAHCPFVLLSDDMTARQLFRDKPLLFRAILLAGTDLTVSKRREIRRSINAWIGQHLLVLDEGDVGVLQGLIVYIAWSNPDFCSDSKVTQLLYFIVGLAHRLGITRPDCATGGSTANQARTNEERRTLLACYYFLSINSIQFARVNPLASPAVGQCIDCLDTATEVLSDFLVAKMVRIQQYIEQIPAIYHGFEDGNSPLKSCEAISVELEAVKLLLWSLHHLTLLHLYMPMTYMTPRSEEVSKVQLECMVYCLQTGRTFASMLQTLGAEGFLFTPFTTLSDIITLLIALCRLLLIDIQGWDLKAARDSIDMSAFFETLTSKLIEAGKIKEERIRVTATSNPSCYIPDGPSEPEEDSIYVLSKRISMIRDWYECQTASDGDSMSNVPARSHEYPRVYVGPSQPQWDQTYFFQSIMQVT
ncbi:hypothetical protein GGR57DRAFT_369355 [Xylariaceae sp. FL1272]|nr:hypothetical protein GGR57DRAFT_369355 [Xylariaceae sp. FL1272]